MDALAMMAASIGHGETTASALPGLSEVATAEVAVTDKLDDDVKAALARAQCRVAVKYADFPLLLRAWATLRSLAAKLRAR